MVSKKKKLPKAIDNLKAALQQYQSEPSELNFLTVVKTFETAVEYSWRDMKRAAQSEGLEIITPKMAIREAARMQLISEPETWIECLNARNNSVHDYFGVSEKEYIVLVNEFIRLIANSKLL